VNLDVAARIISSSSTRTPSPLTVPFDVHDLRAVEIELPLARARRDTQFASHNSLMHLPLTLKVSVDTEAVGAERDPARVVELGSSQLKLTADAALTTGSLR
jgi:hypothetical protein